MTNLVASASPAATVDVAVAVAVAAVAAAVLAEDASLWVHLAHPLQLQ